MLDENWRTSSRSGGDGNCVEVCLIDGEIRIRDSKDREGGTLRVHPSAWRAFLDLAQSDTDA